MPSARERREFVSLMASRVGDAYVRKPFFVDGATDLVTLCRELSRARPRRRAGARRRRASASSPPPTCATRCCGRSRRGAAVREVATFEPWSVSVDDELFDAMLLMLRHRIHRRGGARGRRRWSASSASST